MATKYWVAKDSTFGTSSGAGTEANPYVGALAVRSAIGTGIVSGDTIIFMGEYGPIGLADAADFANTYAATTAHPLDYTANLSTTAGIIFGDTYASTSNVSGTTWLARGDIPWHVDMRGATTNAQRQRFAIAWQGNNLTIRGWRIAASNYNYIGDGTNGVGNNTKTPAGLSASYAAETSFENIGMLVWGAWGCTIEDNIVWGSDAFSRWGILVGWHSVNTSAYQGKKILVRRNTCYGSYQGIAVNIFGALNGDSYRPPANSLVYVGENKCYGQRWGDTTVGATVNNTLYHSGAMSITGSWKEGRGRCIVANNDLSGDAQDLLEVIATNVVVRNNYIHDQAIGRGNGDNISVWLANGTGWSLQNYAYGGNGIKLGLSGYDGTSPASTWLGLGTASGIYNVDECRNICVRNRIINPATVGIACNGSRGMFIHANEITVSNSGVTRGVHCASTPTVVNMQWISNNYISLTGGGANTGIFVPNSFAYIHLYNNIIDAGTNGSSLDLSAFAAATIVGANNFLVRNTVSAAGSVITGTITGTPAYTVGVGPTAGGNCDGVGSATGINNNNTNGGHLDITGRRFDSPPSVGPREVA